jgi:hypothetical protein
MYSRNPKTFWTYVKSRISGNNNLPSLSNQAGVDLFSDQSKADAFSQFFSSSFTSGSITNIPQENPGTTVKGSQPNFWFTPSSVLEALSKLGKRNTAGQDGIPYLFLRRMAIPLAEPLSSIFNNSLYRGEVPLLWKTANVIPVPKAGMSTQLNGYRPISLTSSICKVFEKILRQKILDFCLQTNKIDHRQFGFLPRRSVELQLLKCMNDWTFHLEQGETVDIIYFDISKAFDTVPHSLLLEKLHALDLNSNIISWIRDYLSGRTFQVTINRSKSCSVPIPCGVPQGSILGPLLFILYLNDLPSKLRHAKVAVYADDIKIYCPIKSFTDGQNLQEDINIITDWVEANGLTLSLSKCTALRLLPTRRHPANKNTTLPLPNYFIGQTQLKLTDSVKDLGVTIDSSLNFQSHIHQLVCRANRVSGTIRRVFYSRNQTFRMKLFKAFVRPILETATSIWSPSLVGTSKEIEGVQRSFTKSLPGMFDMPYRDRLHKLGLTSLAYRRLVNDLVHIFKLIKGYYHPFLDRADFLSLQGSGQTRGHSLRLTSSISKSQVRAQFWSRRSIRLWNKLPPEAVGLHNYTAFKAALYKNSSCKILLTSTIERRFSSIFQ